MDFTSSPLSRGGEPKQLSVMHYLLRQGADPNLDDFIGMTALYSVVADGDMEATRSLLDAGANPRGSPSHDQSPLGHACYMGHLDIAELLHERGAPINERGELGASPLHQSVGYRDSPDIVRWLISQGADVNARDNMGQTPLHRAAEYGRVETVRLLLSAGADQNIQDRRGGTPLSIARSFATSIIGGQMQQYGHTSAQQLQNEMLAAMQKKTS